MLQRQIPQETVSMSNSSNSHVDPLHPERIYFTFPKNWSTNTNKVAIIGIRSMYVTRAFRRCMMTIRQTLNYKDSTGTTTLEAHEITVTKFFKDDTLLQDYISKINHELDNIKWNDITAPNFTGMRTLECYYEFYEDNDRHRSRFVIKSPYNDLDVSDRIVIVEHPPSGLSEDNKVYFIDFEITAINDDACMVFNYDKSKQYRNLCYF